MAEAAVKSAADWLGKLLIEEGKYLYGAEEKVEELRDELVWMQCFLRDAESTQYDDEIVGQWVRQIKEYVSTAEDIVDDFAIKVVYGRRRTGWLNKLKRYSCILCELKALHEVCSCIDSLKLKISALTPKLKTYGLKTAYGMKAYRSREALSKQAQERLNYLHLEDKDIVGLEEDTKEVVGQLLDSELDRRVVAIHGMGGLGKTTLARKVYQDEEIRGHFSGGFAWVYISQQFQVRVVFQGLVSSLTSKPSTVFAKNKEQELIGEIREFLEKNRCLVVLDDVWNKEDWDSLRAAFPSYGKSSGSKVLLTTRKDQVAKYADGKALHLPKPLDHKDSWKLLEKTLGVAITEFGNDGDKMVELGKEMAKHCNGLPLAIVVLGGILRKKETLKEWQDVLENITSYLRRGNDHGRSYMEVLLLSYNDLPYQLKPCFLHLGNFPEDHEIRAEKLYRMWVAEGLVTWPHDRVSGTECLEDVANDYLTDLAQAGMIEIMKKGSDGRIKSVRVHDLIRDVCLQKAAAENFLSTVDHRPCPDVPRISSFLNQKRLLRMAVYLAHDVNRFLPDSITSKTQKYLRSLLLFSGNEVDQGKAQDWMKRICNDFPWLRVLDTEGFSLEGRLTRQVKNLIHLRYLSLKQTKIFELPSSIGNLKFLQILDIRVASSSATLVKIPNTLWKLDQLRHLFLPKINYEIKRSKVLWLDTLSCLETLKNLGASKFRPEDLLKLVKLRKLSVKGVVSEEESLKTVLKSPAIKSGSLQSCSLVIKGNIITINPRLLSSYDCIHHLSIEDVIIVKAEPVVFPRYLKMLRLESCRLENDPMSILGDLCHLKDLFLGRDSYVGKEMICRQGSFPELMALNLEWLVNFRVWKVEEASMPKLKRLAILNCGQLERIPDTLPSSVHIICSPCITGIERYGTCICYRPNMSGTADYKEEFIGLAEDTKWLVQCLVQDDCKKLVIRGSSGMGKASLAKLLYHHPEVRMHFSAAAWTQYPRKASPTFPRHTLLQLSRDLSPEESKDLSQKSSSDLIVELKNIMQQKKCLVVFTDLTDSGMTHLNTLFGLQSSGMQSTMLVTSATSHEESAMKSNELIVHRHRTMSEEGKWALFQKRLESTLNGNDAFIKLELAKSMLKHLPNHPLSIIMLAGLLVLKETLIEWETMEKEVTSRLEKGKDFEVIFALCYDDLPLHLRPCFLSLANFPEDAEISTKRLYNMWIASGFVRIPDDGPKADQILVDVAETYLNELVRRGMVQVTERGLAKRISACQLHSLLRSQCLKKAKQERFLSIIGEVEESSSVSNVLSGTQQVAVFLNQGESILPVPTSSNERINSLLFFPNVSDPMMREGDWGWLVNICRHFQQLQVLDLEGMWMVKTLLPPEIGTLTQLRYLSLKGTSVNQLPPSIEKLSDLQTLDLRVVESILIPDVLWKLKCLRHLYLPRLIDQKSGKLRLDGLEQLLTLVNLSTSRFQLADVKKLKNLRKISIAQMQSLDELEFMLESQSSSLDLSINSEVINESTTILSGSKKLKKLRIKGKISETVKLEPHMFPECLEELTLKDTHLKDDPIPVFQKLPQLKSLCFDRNSFAGKKLTFSRGFRQLTHLMFRLLNNLEELDMTAAKRIRGLESLVTTDCWRLKKRSKEFAAVQILGGRRQPHPLLGLLRRG